MKGNKDIKKFRPISLLGCIYKLISKLLARRLTKVLGESQHAFVEGRQILDVVKVANEVVDDLVSSKRDGILIKLDMEKTYDCVNWEFVEYILRRLGFEVGEMGDELHWYRASQSI